MQVAPSHGAMVGKSSSPVDSFSGKPESELRTRLRELSRECERWVLVFVLVILLFVPLPSPDDRIDDSALQFCAFSNQMQLLRKQSKVDEQQGVIDSLQGRIAELEVRNVSRNLVSCLALCVLTPLFSWALLCSKRWQHCATISPVG